jgi:hypothetical protein
MATIADTIKNIRGEAVPYSTLAFSRYADQPIAGVGGVLSKSRIGVSTAVDGTFSTTLSAGRYLLEFRVGRELNWLTFTVPSGSATYTIAEVADDAESAIPLYGAAYTEFETFALLKASAGDTWQMALARNWETDDDIKSFWVRTNQTGLTGNDENIVELSSGAFALRISPGT